MDISVKELAERYDLTDARIYALLATLKPSKFRDQYNPMYDRADAVSIITTALKEKATWAPLTR